MGVVRWHSHTPTSGRPAELHDLLSQLSEVVKDVPETCLARILAESEAECTTARDRLQQQYTEKMEALAKEHVRVTLMLAMFLIIKRASSLHPPCAFQATHASQLRPALGHPSKESQLTALDQQERERHKQAVQVLSAHAAAEKVGHTHHRSPHTQLGQLSTRCVYYRAKRHCVLCL